LSWEQFLRHVEDGCPAWPHAGRGQFTQDDAHILCTPDQLNMEIRAIADLVDYSMGVFGFEYEVELSTRPEDSIGSDEDWELATDALKQALEDNNMIL